MSTPNPRAAYAVLLAAIDQVRALHSPMTESVMVADDLGEHFVDIPICSSCCTDDEGDWITEDCNDNHEHCAGKPICPTVAVLDAVLGDPA